MRCRPTSLFMAGGIVPLATRPNSPRTQIAALARVAAQAAERRSELWVITCDAQQSSVTWAERRVFVGGAVWSFARVLANERARQGAGRSDSSGTLAAWTRAAPGGRTGGPRQPNWSALARRRTARAARARRPAAAPGRRTDVPARGNGRGASTRSAGRSPRAARRDGRSRDRGGGRRPQFPRRDVGRWGCCRMRRCLTASPARPRARNAPAIVSAIGTGWTGFAVGDRVDGLRARRVTPSRTAAHAVREAAGDELRRGRDRAGRLSSPPAMRSAIWRSWCRARSC